MRTSTLLVASGLAAFSLVAACSWDEEVGRGNRALSEDDAGGAGDAASPPPPGDAGPATTAVHGRLLAEITCNPQCLPGGPMRPSIAGIGKIQAIIDGVSVPVDAKGEFTIPNVAPKYDLSILFESQPRPFLVHLVGLTRRDPVVPAPSRAAVSIWGDGDVTTGMVFGKVTGHEGLPYTEESGKLIQLEVQLPVDSGGWGSQPFWNQSQADGAFQLMVAPPKTGTVDAVINAISFERKVSGGPVTRWISWAKVPIKFVDGKGPDNVVVPLQPIADSFEVTVSSPDHVKYDDRSYVDARVMIDRFTFGPQPSAAPSQKLLLPVLPGASLSVSAGGWTKDPSRPGSAFGYRSGLPMVDGAHSIPLPVLARADAPKGGAPFDPKVDTFQFTPSAPNTISKLEINPDDTTFDAYATVYTTASSFKLPDLSSHGYAWPKVDPAKSSSWTLVAMPKASSTDAITNPTGAPVTEGPAAGDWVHARSDDATFKSP